MALTSEGNKYKLLFLTHIKFSQTLNLPDLSSTVSSRQLLVCYYLFFSPLHFITVRCTIVQSAVLRSHLVCLWRWRIMITQVGNL